MGTLKHHQGEEFNDLVGDIARDELGLRVKRRVKKLGRLRMKSLGDASTGFENTSTMQLNYSGGARPPLGCRIACRCGRASICCASRRIISEYSEPRANSGQLAEV